MRSKNKVCSAEKSGVLDFKLRRYLQNPQKILAPFVTHGMSMIDVGCGPGFFTEQAAYLVGDRGKVFAIDLQQEMLNKTAKRLQEKSLQSRVELQKCSEESLNLNSKADFILVFYMVHEVPCQATLFEELKNALNPKGQILLVEPKFHVNKNDFINTEQIALNAGFKVVFRPSIFFSRALVLML